MGTGTCRWFHFGRFVDSRSSAGYASRCRPPLVRLDVLINTGSLLMSGRQTGKTRPRPESGEKLHSVRTRTLDNTSLFQLTRAPRDDCGCSRKTYTLLFNRHNRCAHVLHLQSARADVTDSRGLVTSLHCSDDVCLLLADILSALASNRSLLGLPLAFS